MPVDPQIDKINSESMQDTINQEIVQSLKEKRVSCNERINININKHLDTIEENLNSVQYKDSKEQMYHIEDILEKIHNVITNETKLPQIYQETLGKEES